MCKGIYVYKKKSDGSGIYSEKELFPTEKTYLAKVLDYGFSGENAKPEDKTRVGSVVKTVSPFVPVVNVVPAANDIVSDFNGKKFTLAHTGKTAIDVMGLMPVVGAIAKKGSKAKDVVKVVDEITDIGKGVDNASDASKATKLVEGAARLNITNKSFWKA